MSTTVSAHKSMGFAQKLDLSGSETQPKESDDNNESPTRGRVASHEEVIEKV